MAHSITRTSEWTTNSRRKPARYWQLLCWPYSDRMTSILMFTSEVSSTWNMAKDGKSWFDPCRQHALAERISDQRAKPTPER